MLTADEPRDVAARSLTQDTVCRGMRAPLSSEASPMPSDASSLASHISGQAPPRLPNGMPSRSSGRAGQGDECTFNLVQNCPLTAKQPESKPESSDNLALYSRLVRMVTIKLIIYA